MRIITENKRHAKILIILILILIFLPTLSAWAVQQDRKTVRISETKITGIENKVFTGKKQMT